MTTDEGTSEQSTLQPPPVYRPRSRSHHLYRKIAAKREMDKTIHAANGPLFPQVYTKSSIVTHNIQHGINTCLCDSYIIICMYSVVCFWNSLVRSWLYQGLQTDVQSPPPPTLRETGDSSRSGQRGTVTTGHAVLLPGN